MQLTEYFYKKLTPEVKHTLLLFIATRIILTLIGVNARVVGYSATPSPFMYVNYDPIWLGIWGMWDSVWYLDIAKNWGQTISIYSFFPLLMRLLGIAMGDYFLAGVIISNISLLVASIFLYKLIRLQYDNDTALRSVTYLYAFPSAFILSAILSESLFLALLVMCFYYARKEEWAKVGVIGFFLTLTRPVGVLVLPPLLGEYLKVRGYTLRKINFNVLFLSLIPLSLLAFSAYNPGWYSQFTQAGTEQHLKQITQYTLLNNRFFVFNLAFLIGISGLLLLAYKKIDSSYLLLSLLIVLVPPLVNPDLIAIHSITRFTVVAFPLYILLARLTSNPLIHHYLQTFLFCMQMVLMVFWATGSGIII
ncbi:MAG: hypothetical protein V1744_02715 [Candidatus Altiarchaeota archaeon]